MIKEDQEVLVTKAMLLGYTIIEFKPFGWTARTPDGLAYISHRNGGKLSWYWELPYEAAKAALKHAKVKP